MKLHILESNSLYPLQRMIDLVIKIEFVMDCMICCRLNLIQNAKNVSKNPQFPRVWEMTEFIT
jgi:hypothetical protein